MVKLRSSKPTIGVRFPLSLLLRTYTLNLYKKKLIKLRFKQTPPFYKSKLFQVRSLLKKKIYLYWVAKKLVKINLIGRRFFLLPKPISVKRWAL